VKVVIDTNVLLISLPKISKYRPIFDGLLRSKFTLAMSNEILQEYLEIIGQKTTSEISVNVAKLLVKLENVEKTQIYFRWNLISKDPNDNKFVDCAVATGAKYLVSNDKDFKILSTIGFPPIKVINTDKFLEELNLLIRS